YPYLDLSHVTEEIFLLQMPEQSTRAFTDRALAYCDVKPQHRFLIENMDTAAQLAAVGYGVAFTVKSYATFFHYDKPVRYFLAGDPQDTFDIFIAFKESAHFPAYTSYFIDLVTAYFQALP
ncbi:MAG: LysR substrate-binding domain-containing protein, partial [Anaerovoracaceae bacterium]